MRFFSSQLPLLFAAFLPSCGARTSLDASRAASSSPSPDGGVPPDGGTGTCGAPAPAPPGPCSTWQAAGPAQSLSGKPSSCAALQLTDALGTSCGVMVAWYADEMSGSGGCPCPDCPPATTLTYATRVVGWDAQPVFSAQAHPALSVQSMASGTMELAENAGTFAAIVDDTSGCRFVPLDDHGADRGRPIALGTLDCRAFAAANDGFSFLNVSMSDLTPANLQLLGPDGSFRPLVPLSMTPGRAVWGRLVFDDGSFLTNTFLEDPTTAIYTSWVQHFDVAGNPLAPESVLGTNAAPLWLAASQNGAIAAWATNQPGGQPLEAQPIDRNGNPNGLIQGVATSGAPNYGLGIGPAPDGDVVMWWLELAPRDDFRFWVQALDPFAMPRGPATLIAETVQSEFRVLVEPTGARALVLYQDEGGIEALPLGCAL